MADLISETAGRVSAAKIDLVAGARSFIVGLGGALMLDDKTAFPVAPAAPATPATPLGGQPALTPFRPGPAGAAVASARTQPAGLCRLLGGGSAQASALLCEGRNGAYHPAGADPGICRAAVR